MVDAPFDGCVVARVVTVVCLCGIHVYVFVVLDLAREICLWSQL